jgi:hypothetical protein
MGFRARFLLLLSGFSTALAAGCAGPVQWLAEGSSPSARTPTAPSRCDDERLRFEPSRAVLLGNRPAALWRWAERDLPTNFRHGRRGRLALIPTASPGVALHASLDDGTVTSLTVQSHATSEAAALPLSRQGVARFLMAATGCSSYTLCHALSRFDEVRFRGHTTCAAARVPLQLVTARSSREVVSVATWVPAIARRRGARRGRSP